MPKPISHRKYLKRLAKLARILHSGKPSAIAFTVISRDSRLESMFTDIREHLDVYCKECTLEDEAYDRGRASEDGSSGSMRHIPDAEGVLLAAGMEWIRLAFPKRRTVEILMAELDLCKALRSIVMKYHPSRLPHEANATNGAESVLMLNEALDRLWAALRDYVPVAPPSRVSQSRPT